MDNKAKVEVLVEALPYVNRFNNYIIVIKYGGNAMINDELKESVMQDILLMKSIGMRPIVVHGGGPFINDMLQQLNVETTFEEGLRVTDKHTMEVVEMVLTGHVNKEIVGNFNKIGGKAVGLSGKDANLIRAKKKYIEKANADGSFQKVDIGFVGEVESINTEILNALIHADYVPVISSVGIGPNGETYNINADYVAGAIAGALKANKFILLTDVEGIFEVFDDKDSLISQMDVTEVQELKNSGVISGGMVPKVDCCLDALSNGVKNAHIIDGRLKHSLLLEIFFDEGIGTMITAN